MDETTRPDESRSEPKSEIVPILEEVAVVSKRQVYTGKVRVSTHTDSVEQFAQAELQSDKVEVHRVLIDRIVDHPPAMRTEGDTTIIPIFEEVMVVEKRLVLKEELHIRRRIETETVTGPVTLRRQHAVVETLDEAEQPKPPTSINKDE